MRVFISGAAGLVGQNLVPALKAGGRYDIIAADKHPSNTRLLRELHPDIEVIDVDLANRGDWEHEARSCAVLIQLHAQIGGLNREAFERNNVLATERLIEALHGGVCRYIVHVSSSVVNSRATDFYTESKKLQERLVARSGINHVVLRPTLMFGWFDRKHLGWLKRFMERSPVFPIPGHGRYLRQPLYAGDFSEIISSCLKSEIQGTFDISGLETINYIDLIGLIRETTAQKTPIVKIPFAAFETLLRLYACLDRNPPFTVEQLRALATPDIFDVIDWPGIFGVAPTPLKEALNITFNDPRYGHIALDF